MSSRSKKRAKKPDKQSESILHRDIKDLKIGRNLRRLGKLRITEWEFRDILPAVSRAANTEIDIDGFVRRAASTEIDIDGFVRKTANYRVTEWDLTDLLGKRERRARKSGPSDADMRELSVKLSGFVRFVSRSLVDRADLAEIRVEQPFRDTLVLKLTLCQKDAAAIIGHGGHTAAAIRGIIKDAARKCGARASLRILTLGEDANDV